MGKKIAAAAVEDGVAMERPYHHGSLPEALLEAAETVLNRNGLKGLTLRAIAREAGVSHTAPKPHFGDTAGVLSELAGLGHRRLAAEMLCQAQELPEGRPRRQAIARGYVRFAARNPELFRLMSRSELLDFSRPTFQAALRQSVGVLLGTFDASAAQGKVGIQRLDDKQAVTATAGWSFVHGLASLLVDRQLRKIASGSESYKNAEALVEAVIERVRFVVDAPASE